MKIRAIALQTANAAQGPKLIRLLINRPSVSFEDAEEQQAVVQEIELSEEDVREGKKVPLRFVRFQSINSLHVSAFSRYALIVSTTSLCLLRGVQISNTKNHSVDIRGLKPEW